jgi:hypothetical protein
MGILVHILITHGIADANSAIEAAMHITNRLGINHPKTIPTCPPAGGHHLVWDERPNDVPERRGKMKIDDTDATTPMIEKANAIVSISYVIDISIIIAMKCQPDSQRILSVEIVSNQYYRDEGEKVGLALNSLL